MSIQRKRILIVDDEPTVAMVLAESLERLSKGYIIDTASDAAEALKKIAGHPYDLMITDYRMPGMNGLDLAVTARRTSPKTQIVLMTAYGTDRLQSAADEIGLSGYISKPFTMPQIREIVEHVVEKTENNEDPYRAGKKALERPVYQELKQLQANTGARCIMLISSNGYPVETAGQTNNIDVTSVGALVAANFMAAAELANMLGKGTVFKSSYHEGQGGTDYNLYAYDVNGDLLLVVVFGAESKAGAVWFYTKQTAASLEALIGKGLVTTLPIQSAHPLSVSPEGTNEDSSDWLDGNPSGSKSVGAVASPGQSLDQYLSQELDNLLQL
ncbi:MAG TPA: response regulator [Anaerolineaceae bacterium]|nr:response regulator [Anaerolineaceae bacterium]